MIYWRRIINKSSIIFFRSLCIYLLIQGMGNQSFRYRELCQKVLYVIVELTEDTQQIKQKYHDPEINIRLQRILADYYGSLDIHDIPMLFYFDKSLEPKLYNIAYINYSIGEDTKVYIALLMRKGYKKSLIEKEIQKAKINQLIHDHQRKYDDL